MAAEIRQLPRSLCHCQLSHAGRSFHNHLLCRCWASCLSHAIALIWQRLSAMAHQSTTQLPFLTAHTFIHMHETEVRNWACLHAPAAITTLTQYGIAMFSAAVPAFWRQMSGGSLASWRLSGRGLPGGSLFWRSMRSMGSFYTCRTSGSCRLKFWRRTALYLS